jgi:uncharacterized protein
MFLVVGGVPNPDSLVGQDRGWKPLPQIFINIMESPETYRSLLNAADLISTRIRIRESDLLIRSERGCAGPARKALARYRMDIEDYIAIHPGFKESLLPIVASRDAPPIITAMTRAAILCGVGPMATIAGALAYSVGKELKLISSEVIVENGGDIYLDSRRERIIAVYSGENPGPAGGIGIKIPPEEMPLGIAASSGRLGRSLSWGMADAAVVLASDSILADGGATALANRVYSGTPTVLEAAGEFILGIPGIIGYLIVCGDLVSTGGRMELVVTD